MVVPSPEEAPVCKAKEGEYRIYVMLPYDAGRNFEIYQGELTRNARMESESHGEQTWEYLTVVSGEVELILEDSSFLVKTGGLSILPVTGNISITMWVRPRRYST